MDAWPAVGCVYKSKGDKVDHGGEEWPASCCFVWSRWSCRHYSPSWSSPALRGCSRDVDLGVFACLFGKEARYMYTCTLLGDCGTAVAPPDVLRHTSIVVLLPPSCVDSPLLKDRISPSWSRCWALDAASAFHSWDKSGRVVCRRGKASRRTHHRSCYNQFESAHHVNLFPVGIHPWTCPAVPSAFPALSTSRYGGDDQVDSARSRAADLMTRPTHVSIPCKLLYIYK